MIPWTDFENECIKKTIYTIDNHLIYILLFPGYLKKMVLRNLI